MQQDYNTIETVEMHSQFPSTIYSLFISLHSVSFTNPIFNYSSVL